MDFEISNIHEAFGGLLNENNSRESSCQAVSDLGFTRLINRKKINIPVAVNPDMRYCNRIWKLIKLSELT